MVKMLTAWWQDRRNRTTVSAIVWFLLLLYSIVHVGYSLLRYFGESDFDVMLRYARTLFETGVYPDYGRYTYPPLYFLLMRPFIRADPMVVRVAAYGLFAVLLVWTIVIMARLYAGGSVSRRRWLLIGILCANYQPLLEALSAHSIESVELWLIAVAVAAFLRGRKRWCGALIMIATNLKFFPGVFLLYFLYKREWRVVQGALAALAGITLAVAIVLGPSVAASYLVGTPIRIFGLKTTGLGDDHSGLLTHDNILNLSLRGAINRLFQKQGEAVALGIGAGHIPVHNPLLAQTLTLTSQAFLLLWLAYLFRNPIRTTQQFHLESLLVLVSFFFITPASVSYYAVFLTPACVWLALTLIDQPPGVTGWIKSCMVGWYLLVGNFLPLGLLHYLPRLSPLPYFHNVYWYWWYGFPLWGDILLTAALSAALRRELRRTTSGAPASPPAASVAEPSAWASPVTIRG